MFFLLYIFLDLLMNIFASAIEINKLLKLPKKIDFGILERKFEILEYYFLC